MKKVLLSLSAIMVLVFSIEAQDLPIDEETGKVTFSEVVQVDGASKEQLFKRSRNFGTYKKENVITDDAAEGKYSTKSQFSVKYPSPVRGMLHEGVVSYTITIYVKDGRYKYELTNFVHSSGKGNGGKLEGSIPECGKYTLTLDGWKAIKAESKKEAEKIVENLKNAMSYAPPQEKETKKDDW